MFRLGVGICALIFLGCKTGGKQESTVRDLTASQGSSLSCYYSINGVSDVELDIVRDDELSSEGFETFTIRERRIHRASRSVDEATSDKHKFSVGGRKQHFSFNPAEAAAGTVTPVSVYAQDGAWRLHFRSFIDSSLQDVFDATCEQKGEWKVKTIPLGNIVGKTYHYVNLSPENCTPSPNRRLEETCDNFVRFVSNTEVEIFLKSSMNAPVVKKYRHMVEEEGPLTLEIEWNDNVVEFDAGEVAEFVYMSFTNEEFAQFENLQMRLAPNTLSLAALVGQTYYYNSLPPADCTPSANRRLEKTCDYFVRFLSATEAEIYLKDMRAPAVKKYRYMTEEAPEFFIEFEWKDEIIQFDSYEYMEHVYMQFTDLNNAKFDVLQMARVQ